MRGSRRLTGREEWAWYLVAGVSYVSLSIFHKWLLNWIIGPLWLVAVVCLGPALFDRLRGRTTEPGTGDPHQLSAGSADPQRRATGNPEAAR